MAKITKYTQSKHLSNLPVNAVVAELEELLASVPEGCRDSAKVQLEEDPFGDGIGYLSFQRDETQDEVEARELRNVAIVAQEKRTLANLFNKYGVPEVPGQGVCPKCGTQAVKVVEPPSQTPFSDYVCKEAADRNTQQELQRQMAAGWLNMRCLICGTTWDQRYKNSFVGVSNIKLGN